MKTNTFPLTLRDQIKPSDKTLQRWMVLVSAAITMTVGVTAADLVWIGGTGNWNVAGNWSPGSVPNAADNAWITNSGTYTVMVPSGSSATVNTVTIGSSSGTQTLSLDRATFTLNGASVVKWLCDVAYGHRTTNSAFPGTKSPVQPSY